MGLKLKTYTHTYGLNIVALLSLTFSCFIMLNWCELYLTSPTWFYFLTTTNLLAWSLMYTGILCGFLVFIFSDVKVFFKKSWNLLFFMSFVYSIWLFINEENPLNLFLIYELFLLPSFLLVYRLSPNRSAMLASIYFLTWTQFGSLLVLMGMMWIFLLNSNFNFLILENQLYSAPFWLIFLGFGMKMPMWPFYYWLTKTHVEASSFFSMYLSGFLVKTAVFLFMKFYSMIGSQMNLTLFFILFFIGIIDSSIKMWHQTDLKKLIAYTTVQEMNFLCMPILWNDSFTEILVATFIVTHCLLSCIFFFFIDILSKSYATRVTSQITGLVHMMPTFTFLIFISWILFSGLPFTIKFLLEIGIFSLLYTYNFYLTVCMLIMMNVIGLIGFTKNLFNALFGSPILTDYVTYDLIKRESMLLSFLMLNLCLLNICTLLMW